MYLIDACIRFPAITLLCLIAVLALYASAHYIQTRLTAYFCFSLVALLVYSLPDFYGLPPLLSGLSWIFQSPVIILAWLLGLSLFRDNFTLTWRHGAVLVLHYLLESVVLLTSVQYAPERVTFALSLSLILEAVLLMHLAIVGLQSMRERFSFEVAVYRFMSIWVLIPLLYFVLNAEAVVSLIAWLPDAPTGLSFARAILLFGLSAPAILALSKYELQDLLVPNSNRNQT